MKDNTKKEEPGEPEEFKEFVLCPRVKDSTPERIGASHKDRCWVCHEEVFCSMDGQKRLALGASPICGPCASKVPKESAAFLPIDPKDTAAFKAMVDSGLLGTGVMDVPTALSKEAKSISLVVDHLPDVESSKTALTMTIGLILHDISDSRWGQIVDSADDPCGADGCECHLNNAEIIAALDKHREYVKGLDDKIRKGDL